MPGTCVTTIKVLGVTLLGLLTSSLVYTVYDQIPRLIKEISIGGVEASTKKTSCGSLSRFVPGVRTALGILGGASTFLFSLAYLYSPAYAQHPYLLYASFVSPLTLVGVYYFGDGLRYEKRVTQAVTEVIELNKTKKPIIKLKQLPVEDVQPVAVSSTVTDIKPKTSEEDDLGKSYIHVNDDFDVTSTSESVKSLDDYEEEQDTPSEDESAAENVPSTNVEKEVVNDEEPVDHEIDRVLAGKELALTLGQLKDSYGIGSIISGVGFLVASIGVFGEYYYL